MNKASPKGIKYIFLHSFSIDDGSTDSVILPTVDKIFTLSSKKTYECNIMARNNRA